MDLEISKKTSNCFISILFFMITIPLLSTINWCSARSTAPLITECSCDFCTDLHAYQIEKMVLKTVQKVVKKPWTILVYMAADNDLRSFAARNIKQMCAIGSNNNVNIIIHLDIRMPGNQKVTRRYFIGQNGTIVHVNANDPTTQAMDSGDPQTLISACQWMATSYMADNYGLILWNHGTGPLDPERGRVINPAKLFTFNPITQKLDLDRSVGFFDLIERQLRGVCWDDTTRNYLNNQKLDYALNYICTNILYKKFKIIGFDACLMSTLEIAEIIKKYADIMVSSQEVELGAGWNYTTALEQFLTTTPTARELANRMVSSYQQAYSSVTNDYTLSAIDLANTVQLEENINKIAQLLLEAFTLQKNNSVKNALRLSRNKINCTHFDEPSYIDLYDFYRNLENNLRYFVLNNKKRMATLIPELKLLLGLGKKLIEKIVFANVTGKNLSKAKGISIYFPEQFMHSSYPRTSFAATNKWATLLKEYLV